MSPLTLDALAFGNLVHETLQTAVSTLEANGTFGKATVDAVNKAVEEAVVPWASQWETGTSSSPYDIGAMLRFDA